MGRAGTALKRVLDSYGISQNQLATRMGIDRSNVSRWVSGSRDPSAEAVAEIRIALAAMKAEAGEAFVQMYLYEPAPVPDAQAITGDSMPYYLPDEVTAVKSPHSPPSSTIHPTMQGLSSFRL
jgi:transcriptional regulator with XRE-family HTH domain